MGEQLWISWISHNASKTQIEDIIKNIEKNNKKADQGQIQNDWKRLESFMGGLA